MINYKFAAALLDGLEAALVLHEQWLARSPEDEMLARSVYTNLACRFGASGWNVSVSPTFPEMNTAPSGLRARHGAAMARVKALQQKLPYNPAADRLAVPSVETRINLKNP